jgi:hypothetical protein
MDSVGQLTDLIKALTAGNYDAAPSSLVQGSSLQIEDLSSVMNNVTFTQKNLKLQGMLKTESCKSTIAQFNRQLSYGQFQGHATLEGGIGQENNADYVRCVVPMRYYSEFRRVTLQSTLVATVDGKKADEREAENAAINLAGAIELDLFRGMDDFSNAGVFDGNPLVTPVDTMPNMLGLGLQVRQSDMQINTRDLMFAEYGSEESVVLSGGGSTLTQGLVEDASLRSSIGFGDAKKLVIDEVSLSAYNKITFNKERIILAGAPQDATGGDLRKQWVSGGTVAVEASPFLRAKFRPARPSSHSAAPVAPVSVTEAHAGSTTGLVAGNYVYYATTGNEIGESVPCASVTAGIALNDKVTITITHPASGTFRFFNVYRSAVGGTTATAKYIGRVKAANAATTDFVDLGNKIPGFVTGYLIQEDGAGLKELCPYSRQKLAVTDLSTPEAHFRFLTLAVTKPRQFVLIDNIKGTA